MIVVELKHFYNPFLTEQVSNLMRGGVVEVSDVVVDLVPGKPLPAKLALHRELADVEDDRELRVDDLGQALVAPLLDSVTLDHVSLEGNKRLGPLTRYLDV